MIALKYIAPYLPYNINMIFEKSGRIITVQSCFYNGSTHVVDTNEGNHYDLSLWNFKLLLHPLSDLVKPIKVYGYNDGKEFIPIVELLKIRYPKWFIEHEEGNRYSKISYSYEGCVIESYVCYQATLSVCIRDNELYSLPYWIMERLIEWNFDVFGKIEEGEAIDINTINEQIK